MENTIEQNNSNEQQTIKPKRKYERKEGFKCGRPKKYETEEQAKSKAREQRNQFKKRQAEINKKFKQSITQLQRVAIQQIQKIQLNDEDTISIINILDKYNKTEQDQEKNNEQDLSSN